MGFTERPRRIVQPGAGITAPAQKTSTAPPSSRVRASASELLATRPDSLLNAMRRLDAGLGEDALRETAGWLREQYAQSFATVPLGFVSRCFLGSPYVDHRLGLDGGIMDHFSAAEKMPEPFGDARMLARSAAYAYVEVYADGLVLPILTDGGVVRPGSPRF